MKVLSNWKKENPNFEDDEPEEPQVHQMTKNQIMEIGLVWKAVPEGFQSCATSKRVFN